MIVCLQRMELLKIRQNGFKSRFMFIFLQNCSHSVYLTKRLLNRGIEGIIGAISPSTVTQGGNTP